MTRYRNTAPLPRERRGDPAAGDTCHHGRALRGEGCPACGAEAGEHVDLKRVESVRAWLPRRLDHPGLAEDQRSTLAILIKRYGTPFTMSIVAGSAIPAWQNIGPVSVRKDGAAHKVSTAEPIDTLTCAHITSCPWPPADRRTLLCAAHHERYLDQYMEDPEDAD